MNALVGLVAAATALALVACSSADQSSGQPSGTGTPSGSALAGEDAGSLATGTPDASTAPRKADDPNATVAERCKDDLRCTLSDGSSLQDVTARMRRVAGKCFIATRYNDGDVFTHELKADGVLDTAERWTSDTEHVVLVFGGWLTEDCSLP